MRRKAHRLARVLYLFDGNVLELQKVTVDPRTPVIGGGNLIPVRLHVADPLPPPGLGEYPQTFAGTRLDDHFTVQSGHQSDVHSIGRYSGNRSVLRLYCAGLSISFRGSSLLYRQIRSGRCGLFMSGIAPKQEPRAESDHGSLDDRPGMHAPIVAREMRDADINETDAQRISSVATHGL